METLTLVGTFLTASFWMMRSAMNQQRIITERFIQHLERMIEDQKVENQANRASIRQLVGAVRRNSSIVERLGARREE
jgi:hypothetical protein